MDSEDVGRFGGANSRAPKVFISHHHSQGDIARSLTVSLQESGLETWMAPDNVLPGESFDEAIIDAIESSDAIIVLFSAAADRSIHVKRELMIADKAELPILPLRIEDTETSELRYFLQSSQWVDWFEQREEKLEPVIDRIRSAAMRSRAGIPEQSFSETAPLATMKSDNPEQSSISTEPTPTTRSFTRWQIWSFVGVTSLALWSVFQVLSVTLGDGVAQSQGYLAGAADVAELRPEDVILGNWHMLDGDSAWYIGLFESRLGSTVRLDMELNSDRSLGDVSFPLTHYCARRFAKSSNPTAQGEELENLVQRAETELYPSLANEIFRRELPLAVVTRDDKVFLEGADEHSIEPRPEQARRWCDEFRLIIRPIGNPEPEYYGDSVLSRSLRGTFAVSKRTDNGTTIYVLRELEESLDDEEGVAPEY